jgi:hypothetical protein
MVGGGQCCLLLVVVEAILSRVFGFFRRLNRVSRGDCVLTARRNKQTRAAGEISHSFLFLEMDGWMGRLRSRYVSGT